MSIFVLKSPFAYPGQPIEGEGSALRRQGIEVNEVCFTNR